MAIPFSNSINLNQYEVQNARIQNLTSNPGSGVVGQIYYNTASSVLRVYDGTNWNDLAVSTGTSTITSVTGTNGVTAATNGSGQVTVQHADTSTQSSVSNVGATVIQGVTLDGFGHITGLSSQTITLGLLGFTGAADADNYGGFQVSTNSGTSSEVGPSGVLNIVGDGVSTSASGLSITITNTDKGSSQSIFKNVAGDIGTNAVADSNNDTLTIAGGSGVSTSGDEASDTITVSVDNTVVRTSGDQIIAGNKNFSGDIVFEGNVSMPDGVTITVSETVNVKDSIMYLNSNAPDTPVDDSGFIVNRGLSANVGLIWDESEGVFSFINTASDGSAQGNVVIDSYASFRAAGIQAETLDLTNVSAATVDTDKFLVLDGNIVKTRTGALLRQDIGAGTVNSVNISASGAISASGGPITNSGTITLTARDATTEVTGVVELATNEETRAMQNPNIVVTPVSLEGLRARATINGNDVSTSFAVTHNLGTRDVIVQVVENVAPYATVYTDVERNSTSQVTIGFGSAVPTGTSYRVLIYRI